MLCSLTEFAAAFLSLKEGGIRSLNDLFLSLFLNLTLKGMDYLRFYALAINQLQRSATVLTAVYFNRERQTGACCRLENHKDADTCWEGWSRARGGLSGSFSSSWWSKAGSGGGAGELHSPGKIWPSQTRCRLSQDGGELKSFTSTTKRSRTIN